MLVSGLENQWRVHIILDGIVKHCQEHLSLGMAGMVETVAGMMIDTVEIVEELVAVVLVLMEVAMVAMRTIMAGIYSKKANEMVYFAPINRKQIFFCFNKPQNNWWNLRFFVTWMASADTISNLYIFFSIILFLNWITQDLWTQMHLIIVTESTDLSLISRNKFREF